MKLRYAYKVMARDGESQCGDAVMARIIGDRALFAVIDGLGHGAEAARVAQRAMATLSLLSGDFSACNALSTLQQTLHGTRGAAATVCALHELSCELCGIGNVSCRTLAAPMPFVPKPGIVGGPRKNFNVISMMLSVGQRLVLHSDGVSHRFDLRVVGNLSPEETCDYILAHHRHAHDDASVLVIDAGSIRETSS